MSALGLILFQICYLCSISRGAGLRFCNSSGCCVAHFTFLPCAVGLGDLAVGSDGSSAVSERIKSIHWIKQCFHSSGAVWESRWPSWAVRPNEPSGFLGRKELLNHASALVTTCPSYVNWHLRTLSNTSSSPPYPLPPFSSSLISLTVSVDVKHHVYLLMFSPSEKKFWVQFQFVITLPRDGDAAAVALPSWTFTVSPGTCGSHTLID